MTRILALLLSLSLVLVSCGSTPNDGKTHITLWQGINPPTNREVLQKLVDRFNRSQNEVFVESIYAGQSDQQIPKILSAVVGNAAPDLLWYTPTLTGRLVELDAIRPLDDLLAKSPLRDRIDPAMLSTMQWRNRIWSVPFATNNIGIFYRPSLFKAAGIEKLPQNWTELRQVARKLTLDRDGDGRIDQRGIFLPLGKGEFTVFIWTPFLWSAGGDLFKGDRPQLATPEAQTALQLWQDLVRDNSAMLSQPERGYEEDNFVSGKVAMQISGSWALRFMSQKKIDFDVMPIPQDRYPATTMGGENLFLLKSTPEREAAAWKFAEFVIGEEFQTEWARQTGYLPINLDAQRSSAYAAYVSQQPAVEVFLNQMRSAKSRPLSPEYPRISESIGRAIEATLLQKRSPAEALAEAQRNLDLALGKP
ncbi:ABC transporter substrate-binding protein [Pseudanabaena sp. PCC 6802]|uniref:ABC transporter substrate-binding protein n=1 Tax=Pseudanabaena sp. PCC 6802 TaxID=118173 RepID=UPI00034BE694|nr:ABC transporter substrate-binding protein [Pseudanabaena sp. PCC 6802]